MSDCQVSEVVTPENCSYLVEKVELISLVVFFLILHSFSFP